MNEIAQVWLERWSAYLTTVRGEIMYYIHSTQVDEGKRIWEVGTCPYYGTDQGRWVLPIARGKNRRGLAIHPKQLLGIVQTER